MSVARLPADLPARPVEEAVRRLALAELERADSARAALVAGDRDEALHDLRVAVRRLRSLLRSHRSAFALDYPRKLVRRLGAVASSTNPGRDAEVQLAWLEPLAATLRPGERPGYLELTRQLAERRDESYRKVERDVVRDFGELATSLRERLTRYSIELRLDRAKKPPTFARASREAIRQGAGELDEKLDLVRSAADESAGHDARIAAKRLRYLLEPLAPWSVETKAPIARLKRLQDLLGELHDGQLLAAHVAAALAEVESRRAQELVAASLGAVPEAEGTDTDSIPAREPGARSPARRERSGFLAVARALGEHRNELFSALRTGWLADAKARGAAHRPPERVALDAELAAVEARLLGTASSWRVRASAPKSRPHPRRRPGRTSG